MTSETPDFESDVPCRLSHAILVVCWAHATWALRLVLDCVAIAVARRLPGRHHDA